MKQDLTLTVNGVSYTRAVEPRVNLGDFLRHDLGLTGTHFGCEHGICGACTVLVDGATLRSCLMFAMQAQGCEVTTVEGLSDAQGPLHPIQQAFRDQHALQCGFCTPGMLLTVVELLGENPDPSEAEVRDAISGNICRCTGYQPIVDAALQAARTLKGGTR
jgi:aerobic-type carbon monoxide dehydrogenase small subunit (CoxS/CutS family)